MIENDRLYEGVVASTYDLLIPAHVLDDDDFFRQAISENGQPALEIGCGTGRLLVRYLEEGLDVEGVDPSVEMLEICRRKATDKGLAITLHQQTMQALDVARRFRTIYVPVSTFMLVTNPRDVSAALARFYEHLSPGGRVCIPLHLPLRSDFGIGPAPEKEWRLRREGTLPDGVTVRCWEHVRYDRDAQIRHARLRCEAIEGGQITKTEERETTLRWYAQEEFRELLEKAGFSNVRAVQDHSQNPAGRDDAAFTFIAERN